MFCTGRTLGQFKIDELGDLLLEQISASNEVFCHWRVHCDAFKTAKILTESLDERFLIDYELIDSETVRVLQAVRHPEQSINQMDLTFYVSHFANRYRDGPLIDEVYLVTREFIDKKGCAMADREGEEYDFEDEDATEEDMEVFNFRHRHEILLQLPPAHFQIFKH